MIGVAKTKAEPGIDLIHSDIPEPDEYSVLVKVDTVGICGSDVHIYEWTPGYEFMQEKFPVIIGHEVAGHVVECGKATSGRLKTGDRVTLGVSPGCGACRFCKKDQVIFCENRISSGRIGLDRNGAMADYFTAREESLYAVPANVSFHEAAMAEPAAVALGAVQLARWGAGDTVLILGPGPIGLIITRLCKIYGAGQILIAGLEADQHRLEIARSMGADEIITVNDNHGSHVRDAVGSMGVRAVFEASGSPQAAALGLEVLGRGGDLVLVGIYPKPVTFDATHHIVRQMKSIKGSYAGPNTDQVLTLIEKGDLDLKPLISEILPLRRAKDGFELARDKSSLKVLLTP